MWVDTSLEDWQKINLSPPRLPPRSPPGRPRRGWPERGPRTWTTRETLIVAGSYMAAFGGIRLPDNLLSCAVSGIGAFVCLYEFQYLGLKYGETKLPSNRFLRRLAQPASTSAIFAAGMVWLCAYCHASRDYPKPSRPEIRFYPDTAVRPSSPRPF